ncbi:hydantoinase/oxoprolinase family protein [Sphingobium subterraneum]|uniref:N-methylhydantoinase A n=1 Tax=Sphingobium subterraneum TaxID=627688 RepID=A0A841J484_9SPHN|nr:hydantoinase/oxoprolinase family protein [Sphingobium subterraneum]MBB6123061.1 N-methylhydantoinase A [Sphingobium subterraneum]
MTTGPYTIGVDTGGTFTDTVVVDAEGVVTIGKQLSTPPEFVGGVEASVAAAADALGLSLDSLLEDTKQFLHGTTIVVNALVTGRGAKIGLIATRGFGDTVFIARTTSRSAGLRSDQLHRYAHLSRPKPTIPVSKSLVREVIERVDRDGRVLMPLDEASVRDAIKEMLDEGAEAIAVCLLWSFRHPAHEERVAAIAREIAPDVPVTISSELVRQIGEYERTTTTGYNAAMSGIAADYVDRLSSRLAGNGLKQPPLIMQGNGGVASVAKIRQAPVNLVGSGPAGGVLASRALAAKLGIENVICTDVGGTTFDVGLIVDGDLELTPTTTLHQHRLFLPLVDVVSIGAGGGSLARAEIVGGTGRLRVGPESAYSVPGPVCYGRGGTIPTVTDADLILGMLDPEFFLGGQIKLDVEAAREAIRIHVADPLGMSIDEAASGIVEIADSHMADLMRQVTVQRGHDPRKFTAFLFGGGGPLHGSAYAAKLGVRNMVVPGGALASVFSAWGIASADINHSFQQSVAMTVPGDPAILNETFEALERAAQEQLSSDGVSKSEQVLQRRVDMRYTMQTNEVTVSLNSDVVNDATLADLAERFSVEYQRLYGKGTGFKDAGIEITACRVQALGMLSRPELKSSISGRGSSSAASQPPVYRERSVYWPELHARVSTPVYRQESLEVGSTITGPAIIELPTTTATVRHGQTLVVDEMSNYFITQNSAA